MLQLPSGMAFNLPRSTKGLRFTGSVKSLEPPPRSGRSALGQPRPRPAPAPRSAPPPSVAPPASMRGAPLPRDAYQVDPVRTPYVGSIRPPVVRTKLDSIDEDVATLAIDRDGLLDVMPGGKVQRPPTPAAARPIPNFRPATIATPPATPQPVTVHPRGQMATTTAPRPTPQSGRLPLAVWLLGAVLAGILGYRFVPDALERAVVAVRVSDR